MCTYQRTGYKYDGMWRNNQRHGINTDTLTKHTFRAITLTHIFTLDCTQHQHTSCTELRTCMDISCVGAYIHVSVTCTRVNTLYLTGKGVGTCEGSSMYDGEWRNGRRHGKQNTTHAKSERLNTQQYKSTRIYGCVMCWSLHSCVGVNTLYVTGRGVLTDTDSEYDGEWRYGAKNGNQTQHLLAQTLHTTYLLH